MLLQHGGPSLASRGPGREKDSIKPYFVFAVLGLGTGAVYAALALGLVLEHRVSGVVNFAHGAMAAYVTYAFVELRASGDVVLPVVGLPGRFHLVDRPPFWLCVAVALVLAAALGLIVYALVFRPLRPAPALARVVASVGLLVALQAVIVLRFGGVDRLVAPVLPNSPITIGGAVVPRDRLLLAAAVVAVTVGLWAVYRFTGFGLASRAMADDPATTARLGRPTGWLAAANWVIASVLAGVAGILVAPITALNPGTYTLLVVPALAAALVGRLSSFAVTTAAALAIGVAQSELVQLQDTFRWLPSVGLREGLPLVVIIAAMAAAGRAVPERSEPAEARLPAARRPQHVAVWSTVGVVATATALFVLGAELRLGLVTSLIGAVVCLSLVLLTGWVGQISLAQMAFAGVAGFGLSKLGQGAGIPFPVAPLLAATLAGVAGLLLALPALRVRGVNLAVVTLAGAVAVEELVFRNPALTGGFGGTQIPAPSLAGIDLGIARGGDYPSPVFGLLVLSVVTALALALVVVRRGAAGRRLLAVRANERGAAAAGIDVGAAKLAAFGASAFVAGCAGTLLGYSQGQLSFASFGVFVSLAFLAVAYVGGIGSVSGALVGGALVGGGIVFTWLDQIAGWGRYQAVIAGLGLVVVSVLFPDGLAGFAPRRHGETQG
ncbi:MAG: ABC transporter permease [Acidimicrobiales bacterium]